ncbi:MAG: anti-sigma F factor [Firmicutes bacterium]|nr:anti-sigma F factor [Bacillota bacterium]
MDKTAENTMTLTVSANTENEAFVRSTVAAFCVCLDPTLEEINDIKTAVSEAIGNSIIHGYAEYDGAITVKAVIKGKTVHIEVSDEGLGIEDIERARTPFFTTKPQEERSGMGFTVMETFMDSLEVVRNSGRGITVRMTKNIA